MPPPPDPTGLCGLLTEPFVPPPCGILTLPPPPPEKVGLPVLLCPGVAIAPAPPGKVGPPMRVDPALPEPPIPPPGWFAGLALPLPRPTTELPTHRIPSHPVPGGHAQRPAASRTMVPNRDTGGGQGVTLVAGGSGLEGELTAVRVAAGGLNGAAGTEGTAVLPLSVARTVRPIAVPPSHVPRRLVGRNWRGSA